MEEIKLDLKHPIKRLILPSRKSASSEFTGAFGSVFKGSGVEFTGFRTYTSNDDANLIDWKASLRGKNLLIREFTEERNLKVFFLLDVSNSMLFSSIDKLKCEYAAELVATLSLAALNGDDNVGMAMFTDKLVGFVPVGRGPKQYFIIKKHLTNPKLYGGPFDFKKSLMYVMNYLHQNSVLVIISDFIGLKGDWEKILKIAASKYSIFGISVRDHLDMELPQDYGQVIFKDPFSDEKKAVIPASVQKEFKAEAEQQMKDVKTAFIKSNSNIVELTTDKPFTVPVMKFFQETSRRWK